MSDRQTLARVIKNTATYYGRTLDPEVLSMMCDDLADLSFTQAINAYELYRKNPKNRAFPLPAQIREIVTPEAFLSPHDQAVEVAARICAAVPKFGWCNSKDAEAFIGPVGWQVVHRQGGWAYICENLGTKINPTSFQAQLRSQLEVSYRVGADAVEHAIKKVPEKKSGELIQANFARLLGEKED